MREIRGRAIKAGFRPSPWPAYELTTLLFAIAQHLRRLGQQKKRAL